MTPEMKRLQRVLGKYLVTGRMPSPHEVDIAFALIVEGRKNGDIAAQYSTSPHAIGQSINRLRGRLTCGPNWRWQLTAAYWRQTGHDEALR